jgi:hypothetical protein
MTDPRCLQEGPDCQGKVEYHLNPDRDDFKTFPRCEFHQQKRLEAAEETRRKYPVIQPQDFDPTYAGERWDEE